jgi:hypothetical protein
MSNEFGYIPESPEQSFGNNKGIFTPTDIYDLTRADKFTQYGQLELIQTQTGTDVASVDFTAIKETEYNVHFMTFDNMQSANDNAEIMKLQFYESGVVESAGVYQRARQNMTATGSFSETRSTTDDSISLLGGSGNQSNEKQCAYAYFYNLGDSTKYSFCTWQADTWTSDPYLFVGFGSGVLPQASTVDGIKVKTNSGNIATFTISLYGIKEYS